MTYSVIIHVARKPGFGPGQFKHHWENIHIPLLKGLVGYDFPLSYTRHYIEPHLYSPQSSPSPIDSALDQAGTTTEHLQGFGDVDGIAVLTFANKEHFERFKGKLADEKRSKAYEGDLEDFVDIAAMRTVFAVDTKATGRDGGMVGWRFVGSI